MYAKEIQALRKEVKELKEVVNILLEDYFKRNPPEVEDEE